MGDHCHAKSHRRRHGDHCLERIVSSTHQREIAHETLHWFFPTGGHRLRNVSPPLPVLQDLTSIFLKHHVTFIFLTIKTSCGHFPGGGFPMTHLERLVSAFLSTITLMTTSCVGNVGSTGAGGGGQGGSSQTGGGMSQSSSGGGGTSSSSGTMMEPCAGVTCGGHGTCVVTGGVAACTCMPGYHAVGLDCVVDETCAGKDCGTCGMCQVVDGLATCSCPQDYMWQGNKCVLAIDPCANANCTADQYCVPEAHCQPLGACVQRCDCSNCPNCGPDNSDGRWNDWQEYCGAAPNQSPATMACNKPCPPGEGCLPYAVPICWPIEGCFSL